ncbi:MAG: hypothetical protein L0G52_14165, partial [Brachybacterium sp.]|nr:hypothetical protein [Brachybacterium sp.]
MVPSALARSGAGPQRWSIPRALDRTGHFCPGRGDRDRAGAASDPGDARRADACHRRAEAETPADATATDDQRAAQETADAGRGGLAFLDELTSRLLAELGETDPRAATHSRGLAVDARARTLREGAEHRAEHIAAALLAVVLL